MAESPGVLHVNDCADVARLLVEAGRRRGLPWRRLGPEQVRPPGGFRPGVAGRARGLAYVARLATAVTRADVLHVHYATTQPLVARTGVPRRPYVLTLHGTDIREQWLDPAYRDTVQRAVDGARRVYYTNVDTADNALAARADAAYRPQYVDPASLRPWRPDTQNPYVAFASRWDASKNAAGAGDFAAALRSATAAAGLSVRLEGLDWGPDTGRARGAGVHLVPRMAHEAYVAWLAGASLVVGQPTGILAVSELEAVAMGVPVVTPHPLLPVPAGEHVVVHGDPRDVVDASVAVLRDPEAAPSTSAGRDWVLDFFVADRWVDAFAADYAEVAASS